MENRGIISIHTNQVELNMSEITCDKCKEVKVHLKVESKNVKTYMIFCWMKLLSVHTLHNTKQLSLKKYQYTIIDNDGTAFDW